MEVRIMKVTAKVLTILATAVLIFAGCGGSSRSQKATGNALTITDVSNVADCDGLKSKITEYEADVDQLKTLSSYCAIVNGGLGNIIAWLDEVKLAPEKVCPNFYDFENEKLAELDTILVTKMEAALAAAPVISVTGALKIQLGIFTPKFKCSPASAEAAKDAFVRIFPKYLIAKKASLFCPGKTEAAIKTAVEGAFNTDILVSALPKYTSSQLLCVTVVDHDDADQAEETFSQ
jgi:hypothetical protein